MASKSKFDGDSKASPGKIFICGLSKDATLDAFKDRNTGHPRGFGFITYADPSVVDKVIEETHVINGKQDYETILNNKKKIALEMIRFRFTRTCHHCIWFQLVALQLIKLRRS